MTTRKYTRNQSSLSFLTALDNEFTRAAVNVVIAVSEGRYRDDQSVQTLAEGLQKAFGNEDPKEIFGSRLGLVRPRGMPPAYGLTPADIVSAHIELELRRQGNVKGALQRAMDLTIDAFIDLSVEDPMRQLRRDWQNGQNTVKGMSDDDLWELLRPYEVA